MNNNAQVSIDDGITYYDIVSDSNGKFIQWYDMNNNKSTMYFNGDEFRVLDTFWCKVKYFVRYKIFRKFKRKTK